MTPAATTAAGRRRSTKRAAGAPVAPRRVSGPATGRIPTGRTTFTPRRETRRRAASRGRSISIGVRARTFVRSLPDHALLDRAIRGRAWIPILGVMLAGIVAMQVEVLKLGASMGRSIDEGTALQSRNELLRANVATLADDQRIERLAAGMGMVMPAPAEVGFLSHHRGDAGRAARSIHTPDASTFLTALQAFTAAAQPATSTTTTTTTTGTPTTTGTVAPVTSTVTPTTSTVTPTTSTVTPTTSTVTPTTTTSTVTPTASGTAATAAVVPSTTSSSTTGG
jgi:hypothetical protein